MTSIRRKNQPKVNRILLKVYGELVLAERTCQKLFAWTKSDNSTLEDDNARPDVGALVKTYLKSIKWEVLLRPFYSLDMVDQDFTNFDKGKKLKDLR